MLGEEAHQLGVDGSPLFRANRADPDFLCINPRGHPPCLPAPLAGGARPAWAALQARHAPPSGASLGAAGHAAVGPNPHTRTARFLVGSGQAHAARGGMARDFGSAVGDFAARRIEVAACLCVWDGMIQRPRAVPMRCRLRWLPTIHALIGCDVDWDRDKNDLDRERHPKICPMARLSARRAASRRVR